MTSGKPLPMDLWIAGPVGELVGCGNRGLLDRSPAAFFASRRCPGTAIRASMDWALQQARAGQVVVSGFHSPLEQSILKVLMAARSPVVAVLARPVQGAKLPVEWAEPLAQGCLAVVSGAATAQRLTADAAARRNALAAQLAYTIVLAYASPGGALAALVAQWRQQGRSVTALVAG